MGYFMIMGKVRRPTTILGTSLKISIIHCIIGARLAQLKAPNSEPSSNIKRVKPMNKILL